MPGDPDVWIFIVAELMLFGAFFLAFMIYRAGEVAVFDESQRALAVNLGALNTLILFTSSWAVASAVAAAREDERARVPRRLACAIGLAAAFVVVKCFEYAAKLEDGFTLTTNTFFQFYYCFTGIHLLHVVGGTVILTVMWSNARRGVYRAGEMRGLETGASYWHMVDLLWVFLFALLYLLR